MTMGKTKPIEKIYREQFSVILHNIRSAHNVGAIFRTTDGAGISKLYLCGYTPCPKSKSRLVEVKLQQFRVSGASKDIAKTALGAEKFVPWEKHLQTWRLIEKLKNDGVQIVALEQTSKSIPYLKFKPKFPLCLIVGNEVTGLPKSILKQADAIIDIPMRGKKESLNVSVAFGIAAYSIVIT